MIASRFSLFGAGLVAALALAACSSNNNTSKPAGAGAKPQGSKTASSVKTSQSTIKAKKPATAQKTTSSPKPVPAPRATTGQTKVTPVDVTVGGSTEVETWSFSDVDLDGDGVMESGVVAATETQMGIWWSSSFRDDDGSNVSYNAFAWIVEDSVGFVIDVTGQGALACAEDASANAGCALCDTQGTCKEVGLNEVLE
jgi:hypothetical protein